MSNYGYKKNQSRSYLNHLLFGPKKKEVTGDWRKLRNKELQDVCFSTGSSRMIKWKRMRWVGQVARTREKRNIYRVLMGKPEGKNKVEDLGVDGNIILKWVVR
jgi:hypothetical protein